MDRINNKMPARPVFTIFISAAFLFACAVIYSPVHAQTPDPTPNPPSFQGLGSFGGFIVAINPPSPEPNTIFEASIIAEFPITSHDQIIWSFDGTPMKPSEQTPPGKIYLAAPNEIGKRIIITAQMNISGQEVIRRAEAYTSAYALLEDAREQEKQLQKTFEEITIQAKKQDEQIYGKREKNKIFSIVADNKNPGPYEGVHLALKSNLLDTNAVFITWSVDGKKIKEGVGEDALSVKTEGIGSQKTVRADITNPDDNTAYSDEITVSPFKINLYWWADTVVPHWYKGKALPSTGSSVRVSAFAPTGTAEQKNFLYRWLLNDTPQYTVSGVNRQTFSFIPVLESFGDTVTLRIESSDKTISAETPITIQNVNPELSFCIVDALAGCTKKAREKTVKNQSDIEVLAIPFFFWKDDTRFMKYEWTLNGRSIPVTKPNPSPWTLLLKNIQPASKEKLTITAKAESIISRKSVYDSFIINLE